MWSKFLKITIAVLSGALVVVCLAAVWLLNYTAAENSMDPEGPVSILEMSDGSFQLTWPSGKKAEGYRVEILEGDTTLYSWETDECKLALPELPAKELTLRIRSFRRYLWTGREGTEALEARICVTAPRLTDVAWTADPETGCVTVTYGMEDGSLCSVYRADNGEILAETEENSVELELAGGSLTMKFRVTRFDGNVTYYGYECASVTVTQEDFKSETLSAICTDLGGNRFALTWNETKGSGYLVEISRDGGAAWETAAEINGDEERFYTTGSLAAFEEFRIRISTNGGKISDEVTVTTAQRVRCSTIWPIQDLAVYADTTRAESLGTASAGEALCVLEETDGMFAIRYGDGIGYIDSRYCMINVAEYLGSLCAYDIPNSYDSLYKVHELEIPQVTGTVITGYESVLQADGSYLVPVLYPAAQKLLEAALTAREQGYRLKIYDSYRPYAATRQIYSLTEQILDTMLPDGSGTIQSFMTDGGRYRLGNFLAPVTSRHNYGVALDLTLEPLDGGAVQMQTPMHDLSWYSALENNTESADLLQSIMVAAGFATLQSEWWHFQDAEAFETLEPAYLTDGITARCWVKDDFGWRYRLEDGTFLTDCVEQIDGISYEFDSLGYIRRKMY